MSMQPGPETSRATEAELAARANEAIDRDAGGSPRGALAEAERAARYRLIAPLARGKRVLDAGCGTAEGCVILAAAGAARVVGVDPEQAVIEAVRQRVPPEIELARAEPSELPHPDASFDLVTCFEKGPGAASPAAWLDELVRVLVPGGLLVASAAAAGAPELERELASRLPNVRVVRERAWVAVALLAERSAESAEPVAADELRLANDPGAARRAPAGAVAFAIASPLAALPELVALAEPFAAERLTAEVERQRAELRTQASRIAELEAGEAERRELRRLLTEAEQLLAELPELERRSQELERVSSSAEWRIATALRVPGRRAEGMWLPAVRRRAKQLLARLIRSFRTS
jgi:SAM-dependent methyltransferase